MDWTGYNKNYLSPFKLTSMKTLTKFVHRPRLGLIILAYVAFIALGMPDGLLGVAWPTIRQGFVIPLDALGMLFLTATSGYLLSSFSSGKLISKFQVGNVLVVSCLLTGTALISYTLVPQWWMMVALGILAGLGAGAIDAGLNTVYRRAFRRRNDAMAACQLWHRGNDGSDHHDIVADFT